MACPMLGGTTWSMDNYRQRGPSSQPNSDTWKVEPTYRDSKTLMGNWYEQRYRENHEKQPYHRKYLLPIRYDRLPVILKGKQVVQTNRISTEDDSPVCSTKRVLLDDSSRCQPVWTSKLPAWHHLNPKGCVPTDDWMSAHGARDLPVMHPIAGKVPMVERAEAQSYPPQVIYGTPGNYGYLIQKRKEWVQQEDTTLDNERQSCSNSNIKDSRSSNWAKVKK